MIGLECRKRPMYASWPHVRYNGRLNRKLRCFFKSFADLSFDNNCRRVSIHRSVNTVFVRTTIPFPLKVLQVGVRSGLAQKAVMGTAS